jgi:D-arabinose 1-dehydrogenase-like Zn-dependent alcohol dehydrogenase
MRCCAITEFGKPLETIEVPTPEPTGDEVLMRVTACGVCHSDLHIWEGHFDLGEGRKADLTSGRELPFNLGHEIAGEVVAVGENVTGVAVGDKRVVFPWIGCGDCAICQTQGEHLCQRSRDVLGVYRNGGYADHVIVPHGRYLFDYGDVPAELACTYACSGITAYSALKKAAKAAERGHLMIIGAGGVGMNALALAREVTDATITVCDIDDGKLAQAKEMGADHVVNSSEKDAPKQVKGLTDGGPAAVIDFVGAPASVGFAMRAMGHNATLVIVGLIGGSMPLSIPIVPLTAMTITGSYVGSLPEFEELMALARAGRVPQIPVEKRDLSEGQRSLDDLKTGSIVGRAVLTP